MIENFAIDTITRVTIELNTDKFVSQREVHNIPSGWVWKKNFSAKEVFVQF